MRWLAVAAALAAAACATEPSTPQPPPPGALPTDTHRVLPAAREATSVDLDNAADGTKVTLARGNELKVMLDAQALAGFHWRVPKGFSPVLAQIGDRIFLSKGLDPRYLGGGGMNVFRYRAERSGKVTLTFEYGPFDLKAPATKTVRYEVTVE
jgi:predicted secreted protein